jgi:hypothetical protein
VSGSQLSSFAHVPEDEQLVITHLRYDKQEEPFGIYSVVTTTPTVLHERYTRRQLVRARLVFEEGVRASFPYPSSERILARSLIRHRLLHAAADPPMIVDWLATERDWLQQQLRIQSMEINDKEQ